MNKIWKVILVFNVFINFGVAIVSLNETDLYKDNEVRILSRRKRFLIFPEGSSVQLVFCLTYPMLVSISDILLFGYTTALAYELPQDPYSPFMHHADPLHRRADTKTLYYLDEDGKLLYKKPFKRKPIVNPAFAKRSVDEVNRKSEIDRKQMHASTHRREFLNGKSTDERVVEFHRSSRASLYTKIETLWSSTGADGKQCLLKTLCHVGKTRKIPQGSFVQEMLRAVFMLPNGDSMPQLKAYDEAHAAEDSCDVLYPECDQLSH